MTRVRIPPPHPFLGGFLTRRIIILLLVASLCFASFTFGVSAADGSPSGTVVWSILGGGSNSCSLGGHVSFSNYPSSVTSLTLVAPSAGTLTVSIEPCKSTFTASGSGSASSVTTTISRNTATVSAVFTSAGSAGITISPVSGDFRYNEGSFTLVSWEPSSGGGGGDEGYSGDWTLGNNFGDWRPGLAVPNQTSTSTQWKTYNQYIGEYVTTVSTSGDSKSFSGPADSFFVSALAALTYDDWSWGVGEDGKMYFSPPAFAEGSWLDNIWRMDVYFYYNLANQTGWFGGVNNRLDTLNARVLQILSVLANDEDVKIKDATTDHRNWITDFFEGENTGKPTTSDNDAVNDSMNTVKDQFQSSYTVGDIGSIFSGNSYDNNIWYYFWSLPVFNDVNGIDRGGFGGGKAPARAPAASNPSWSSQYSYDDDSIPDMSGFGGGLSD